MCYHALNPVSCLTSYHYRMRRIRLSRSRRGLESLVGSPLTTADIALTSPGRDSSDRERRMAPGRGMGAGSQELCVCGFPGWRVLRSVVPRQITPPSGAEAQDTVSGVERNHNEL